MSAPADDKGLPDKTSAPVDTGSPSPPRSDSQAEEEKFVYSAREVRQQRRRRLVYEITSSPSFVAGLVILGAYVALALDAVFVDWGFLTYVGPDALITTTCTTPPGPTLSWWPPDGGAHPFGVTAILGTDVWQALFKGGPWDLLLLAGTLLPSLAIGLVLGSLAGTIGGAVDDAIMAVTDAILSVPSFFVALLVFGAILPFVAPTDGIPVFAVSMVLILWAPFARTVRAAARSTASAAYVESARASGAGRWRIMFRHVLPNSASPVLAQTPATLATILFIMTTVQFIGVFTDTTQAVAGICPVIPRSVTFLPSVNFPEWTWVLASGTAGWTPGWGPSNTWWGYLIPAVWIVVFGLAVNLVCDGLRDLLSPVKRH